MKGSGGKFQVRRLIFALNLLYYTPTHLWEVPQLDVKVSLFLLIIYTPYVATADFMRKLNEHNFNRACLAGGTLGLYGSGKKEALVCRHMFSECDVDLFGTSG